MRLTTHAHDSKEVPKGHSPDTHSAEEGSFSQIGELERGLGQVIAPLEVGRLHLCRVEAAADAE